MSVTLMLFCFNSCVMCFMFFPRQKKSAVLFLDLFLEACLKELMTSAIQTICIWRVLFQNEIFTIWRKKNGGGNDWQLVTFLPCGSSYFSTILEVILLNGCIAFWNKSLECVLPALLGTFFKTVKQENENPTAAKYDCVAPGDNSKM